MLAGHLGMSVKRCRQEVDSPEFALWRAFRRRQPFGDEFRQAAIIACTVANCFRSAGQRAFEIEEFIPGVGRREQTAQDIGALLRSWATAHNRRLAQEQQAAENLKPPPGATMDTND